MQQFFFVIIYDSQGEICTVVLCAQKQVMLSQITVLQGHLRY
jgi:hypothetical protein